MNNKGIDVICLQQLRQRLLHLLSVLKSAIESAATILQSYPARALRALGLLLADGTPTGGRGEDFLTGQLNFFYENCCNSGTESRKIVPKVGN